VVGRSGSRREASGLGAGDVLAIVLVILLLSCSLGALVAKRDARFVARTQQWVRVLASHLKPSLLLLNQAFAQAPPSAPGRSIER